MTRIVAHIKRTHGSNRITPSLPPAVARHKLNLSSTPGWQRVLAGGGGFVSASCAEESGRISLPARLKINRSGWPQVASHYEPRSLRCLRLRELSHNRLFNSDVDRWRCECPERISALTGLASLNTEPCWAWTGLNTKDKLPLVMLRTESLVKWNSQSEKVWDNPRQSVIVLEGLRWPEIIWASQGKSHITR